MGTIGQGSPRVYKEHIGNPWPLVPIPKEYVEADITRDDFQLTFIPEYITIAAGKESVLMLNGEGRLVKDVAAAGRDRTIDVPVTLFNIDKLVENSSIGDEKPIGIFYKSWENIPEHYWDVRVKSHWFYPKKGVTGLNRTYLQQRDAAEGAGLDISSLIDTVIYQLLLKMTTGIADDRYTARTCTKFLVNFVVWTSAVRWWKSEHSERLQLFFGQMDSEDVGVAVGVPARAVPA